MGAELESMPEGPEPAPRGAAAMALVRWAILALVAALAAFVWIAYLHDRSAGAAPATSAKAVARYHCPMHPQIVSDAPRECPICHMDLVPIEAPTPSATPRSARAVTPATASAPGSVPAGTVPISLTFDRIQSIGVRTALAETATLGGDLRVTAIVAAPEQGASEVHVRAPGFVEAIDVDQTGVEVHAGQPLFSLYSPEILQAENELLVTRAWGDAGLATSAPRKLSLLGMTDADVQRVLATREPIRAIAVVAPRSGFVTKKSVVLGSYVVPETPLYEIQDLTRVYVLADVFVPDLKEIRIGAAARFVPSGHPEDGAEAKIDLVYPVISSEARTRRVRMQIANAGARRYAPGEFGTIELARPPRTGVVVPRDALVDTGDATYVFVADAGGRFTPRIVVSSSGDGERILIEAGVAAGERVVSGATFLIDSESRLQASVSGVSP